MKYRNIIATLCLSTLLTISAFVNAEPVADILDIDGNGETVALTDGLLSLRYLFGFRDAALINSAIGNNASRTTSAQIESYIDNHLTVLDVDGNGASEALTDGLLFLRFLFGFTGDSLISGAIGTGATRTTAPEVEAYFQLDPCLDIHFPDPVLEAGLRAKPEIPDTGPISCSDMEALNLFVYHGFFNSEKITDITGLNYAKNLTILNLSLNEITSIKSRDFRGMTSLTTIQLGYNDITSIESGAFSGLNSLINLVIDGNKITSIESGLFSGLTKLILLYLSDNDITSIKSSDFSDLISLITLDISSNKISNIESDAFSGLNSLTFLNLDINDIVSIERGVFNGLTSLDFLGLRNNHISSIESIDFSGLISPTNLNLSGNDITSIEIGSFSGLSSLESLDLRVNDITTIENRTFDGLSSLSKLSIDFNGLTDVSPFKELAHRNVNNLELFQIQRNCLTLSKVPTKGILAGIAANTSNGYDDSANPKDVGTPLCPSPLPKQANSESQFDLDPVNFDELEAWTLTVNNTLIPTHNSSGGQSTGYIQGADDLSGPFWYFKAPQQYYGDASDYSDGSLSFYLKSSGGTATSPQEDIILKGGGITLDYRFDNPTPGADWTFYSAKLSPEGWTRTATFPAPIGTITVPVTQTNMDTVLTNLTSIEIRGDHINGFDTTGLDTVVMQKE